MSNLADELNYDFNYNKFLTKALLPNLFNRGDKERVVRWVQKLETCNKSLEEMRLRNDFMYFLILNVQNGNLDKPFTHLPPGGPLNSYVHLLPAAEPVRPGAQAWAPSEAVRAQLYARSPDGGAFLAAQPVPRCGAFCYLAVVCKPPEGPQS